MLNVIRLVLKLSWFIEIISLCKFTINVMFDELRTSNVRFIYSNDPKMMFGKAIVIVNSIRMFRLVRIRRFSTFRTVKQSKPNVTRESMGLFWVFWAFEVNPESVNGQNQRYPIVYLQLYVVFMKY